MKQKFDTSRLIELERIRDASSRDARAAQARRNDLIASLNAARQELSIKEQAAARRSRLFDPDSHGDAPVERPTPAEIAQLKQKVQDLTAAINAASDHWSQSRDDAQSSAQLFDACVDFLKDQRISLPVGLSESTGTAFSVGLAR